MAGSAPITSRRNPRITAAAALASARERKTTGLTLIEGPHVLEAAVAARAEVVEVFAAVDDPTPDRLGLLAITTRVGDEALRTVAPTTHPRGPVATIRIAAPPQLASADTLLVWGVGDPGNVGTLLRSAAAFGLQLAFGGGSADIWAPKVLRSAAGAHFATNVVPISFPPGELADAGIVSVALVARGGVAPIEALSGPEPKAIIVGSEPHGLPADIVESADRRLTFMLDDRVESLNAAVAGSIAAYLLSQRR